MNNDLPPDIAAAVDALLTALDTKNNRRLAADLIRCAAGLINDAPATLDLKIATSALIEMREAYTMFAPYRDRKKVAIFGSARTKADDPLYLQARKVATHLAAHDWMVVTGAGPGIMQAAMEGAGREKSIGVSIRLPFEQGANPVIAGDSKYVSMKYFFTRKLMLIKESAAFICLPGGFGTLDEMFELLTLTQTGKGLPVPIVFLDTPGDPYWEGVRDFIEEQLIKRRLVAEADRELYLITESCETAVHEINNFYVNYHSMRYVGDLLIVRMQHALSDEQLETLNEQFGRLATRGRINRSGPLPVELKENDQLQLHRVSFSFAKHGFGDLRQMIDLLNSFVVDSAVAG